MSNFLKILGAVVAVAGIVDAVYFAVTKFIAKKDDDEDCEEICCFDEDEVVIEDVEEEETEE